MTSFLPRGDVRVRNARLDGSTNIAMNKLSARSLIKRFLNLVYRPLVVQYLKKERQYRLRGIEVTVKPGVFHPGLFFSTKLLAAHLDCLQLESTRFLELGAGSGLLSILAARRGAQVTASDISEISVQGIEDNAASNGVAVTAICSDMFDNLANTTFDVVIVNPPYFPSNPERAADYAWFCGSNYEYFSKLFAQLPSHISDTSIVRMILSDDCDIGRITSLAEATGIKMEVVSAKRVLWEKNFIFGLAPSRPILRTPDS